MSKNKAPFKRVAVFHNLPGGGSVKVMNNVIAHMFELGYEVDIFTCCEDDVLNRDLWFKYGEKRYKVLPWKGFILRNIWTLFVLPLVHKSIANTIDRGRYDFAIVNHDYFTKSPYLLRYLKTKSLYYLHEPPREFYEPYSFHATSIKKRMANFLRAPIKYVDRENVNCADHIVVNSKYSKSVIDSIYGVKSLLVYPGVDTDIYKPLRFSDKKNQILLTGGLSIIKGNDFVLDAIRELIGKYKVVITGCDRKQSIRKLRDILQEKANYVQVLGYISDDELINLYRESKVTCIGAYKEPFGMTSLESQSCGTPVVAIDEGGYVETVVNGKTGFLSDRDKKVYEKLVKDALIDSKSLGNEARKFVVSNWSWRQSHRELDMIISTL